MSHRENESNASMGASFQKRASSTDLESGRPTELGRDSGRFLRKGQALAGGREEDEDTSSTAWMVVPCLRLSEETQQAFLLCLLRVESLVGRTKGSGCRFQQIGIHNHGRRLDRVGEP